MTDEGFIGFPPGITPPPPGTDSGTRRIGRPERQEIVYRPAVPGAPPAPPPPAAGTAVAAAPPPAEPAASAAPPAPADPAPAPTWRLRIPGVAAPVVVADAVVLGRNPVAPAHAPDAAPVVVDDPAKSVSKTHAVVVVRDGSLLVRDLDSTNGVWVVVAGAEPVAADPGVDVVVPSGADLELGEFVIRVERS